jgi:hypothetical protein
MGYYETGQVCRAGHAINGRARRSPEHNQQFCDKCGEPTILQCESGRTDIRG